MAEDFGALTNMWMLNPTMFDPTQRSNQFSNFNNAPLPWPPTYNTGAGGPTNAATGQPIQSFQNWQAANPAGMSINQTPAQPQPQQAAPTGGNSAGSQFGVGYGNWTNPNASTTSQPQTYQVRNGGGFGDQQLNNITRPGTTPPQQQQAAAPQQQAGAQTPTAPNNWQAAINVLANPGNPQTFGATVPQVSGYQPAGGVNNAFLQNAQGRPGMNQNFLSALAAIQGRPQQQAAATPQQQQPRRWG